MDMGKCDLDVFENGSVVAFIADRDAQDIEKLVRHVAKCTGAKIDWHYAAGRGIVKAIGDIDKVIDALRPYGPTKAHSLNWRSEDLGVLQKDKEGRVDF